MMLEKNKECVKNNWAEKDWETEKHLNIRKTNFDFEEIRTSYFRDKIFFAINFLVFKMLIVLLINWQSI